MQTDEQVRETIKKIIKKYGVSLLNVSWNTQTGCDIYFDHSIHFKKRVKMENKIHSINYREYK